MGPFGRADKFDFADRCAPGAADVYHIGSPVELEVPIDGLWPPQVRRLRFVVTVYDLIPLLFPGIYLREPWQREGTRPGSSSSVAPIASSPSRRLALDVIEHLGVAPERVAVVGTGVSERFRPAETRA